jgi:hypothetical protein
MEFGNAVRLSFALAGISPDSVNPFAGKVALAVEMTREAYQN